MTISALNPIRRQVVNTTKEFIQNNPDNISSSVSDGINDFGNNDEFVSEKNKKEKQPRKTFSQKAKDVFVILTFPITVPVMLAYNAFKSN